MNFYVHTNSEPSRNTARVHVGYCRLCREGKGPSDKLVRKRVFSEWSSRYDSFEAACVAARKSGRKDVAPCGNCLRNRSCPE